MKNSIRVASTFQHTLPLLLIFLVPSLAQAHPCTPGHMHGFSNGLLHQITSSSSLAYGMGFVVATASLHLCGISLGLIAQRFVSAKLIRFAGGAIAGCGVYLCFA